MSRGFFMPNFTSMIQRLQSVFFFLASNCAFAALYLPVVNNSGTSEWGASNTTLSIVSTIAATVFLIAIFLFKNRPFQKNVGRLGLLFCFALVVLIAYFENSDGAFNIEWGAFLPVLGIVLGSLGIRYINKDEKLVRGMDRLR